MAKINYKYCEDKVLYDSGDIEAEMLKLYKEGKDVKGEHFFYSITPVRENIINWYPFKKNSVILEVGGGLGAITEPLCKVAKKVISCEYSKRRAENIYYRHKKYANLEVIVGNLNKIKLKEKVDYIVLIGVYEYAKRFFQTENPFVDFLDLLKSFLKPGGVILIAIENRYGIKYWAGATEDHYGVKYLGLKNYDDYDIETLGKKELTDIIEDAGLFYKFYYPYPDYKMPYVIHTDERLPLKSELSSLQLYNHEQQIYNFDYREVLGGLIDNGQYGFFANSFLVEISNKKNSLSDVVYAKSHWIRSEKYQTITRIDNKKNIVKIAKSKEVENHLDSMCEVHDKLVKLGVKTSKIAKKGQDYSVEFIDGISLTEYIYNLAKKGEKQAILKEISRFHNLLRSISHIIQMKKFINKRAEMYFSKKPMDVLKIGLIDLHMGNVIKQGNELFVIDQEWLVDYDVPVNYIVYFSTVMLFSWVPRLKSLFDVEDLLKQYGIKKKEIEIYLEMSIFFSIETFKNIDIDTEKHFVSVSQVHTIDEEIENTKIELATLRGELETSRREFETSQRELETSQRELASANLCLQNSRIELNNTKAELESIKNRKVIKVVDKVIRIKNKIIK